jgi:hypothetical protein
MAATALAFLALITVGVSGVRWFRVAAAVRLPEDRSRFVGAWLGGVGLGIAALLAGAGGIVAGAAVLAILGGGFLLFTVAISRQRVGPEAVVVGAKLPQFRATDEHGQAFELSTLSGRPILMKFFRGHW